MLRWMASVMIHIFTKNLKTKLQPFYLININVNVLNKNISKQNVASH